jgi:Thrombospondin type 3 repeat
MTLLALASLLLPRAARAADSWTERSAVGVDLALGGIITRYRPDAPDGGSVFLASIRGSYDLGPDTSVSVLLRQWSLPGSNHATMPGLGGRFEPYQGDVGRAFVDVDLGPTWTRDRVTLGFDLGGGFEVEFPAVAGLGIGPSFRYGQVVNPASMGARDGRSWALGFSGTFHIGRWSKAGAAARAQSPMGGKPVRPYTFKVVDSDHDGISDDSDQCPEVAAGRHPDAFRPGCPENDEDGDGVPDEDDVCPATAAGDHPDRARLGCPFDDSDGDGVADLDDHCPDKPGPATRDPATNGCPVARKAAAQPAEPKQDPSDASPADLKPVSKHRLRGPRSTLAPSPAESP